MPINKHYNNLIDKLLVYVISSFIGLVQNLTRKANLEDLGVNGIILKYLLNKLRMV
jgi:hypothetical protein